MELRQALLRRRSVRQFTEQPVNSEAITELLHAAMSGPSACNKTPWQFYVVTNPDKLLGLRSATHFSGIIAPMAIVVCGDMKRALPVQLAQFWVQDCSAATQNILLRAVDLGLGAVWCGIHPHEIPEKRLRSLLELPEHEIPLNIIYIGHPAQQPEPRDQYDADRVHMVE